MVLGPLQAVQSTVTLPNLGAYVTVQANNSTGPAADWPLTLAGTNRIGPTVTPGATTPLVERFIVSVGAGATQNTDFAYFFTGHAHVTFQGGISAGEYKIEQLDETGAVVAHLLRRTLPIAAPGELLAPVMIPPGWLRLAVVNTGGAPASYTATVNPEAWSNYT
jgi:hypothetical protein